jgi:hypothetical protein
VKWLRSAGIFAFNLAVTLACFSLLAWWADWADFHVYHSWWKGHRAIDDWVYALAWGPLLYGLAWGILGGRRFRRFDWRLALLAALTFATWYYAGFLWAFLGMSGPVGGGHESDSLWTVVILGAALGISLPCSNRDGTPHRARESMNRRPDPARGRISP